MKLISIEEIKDFLQSNEFDFKSTQPKLCFPIIQRIHYKMLIGIAFENILVDASSIINGHHRYICLLLSKRKIEINPSRSPSGISHYKWTEVEVDTNDWETLDMIKRHNERDIQRTGCNEDIFNKLMKNLTNYS